MTVSSGWNSREVSLNGRLIGVTVSTPGSAAEAARAGAAVRGPTSPTTAITRPLRADMVERRHPLGQDLALDAEDLGLAGADGHHDEHLLGLSQSVRSVPAKQKSRGLTSASLPARPVPPV